MCLTKTIVKTVVQLMETITAIIQIKVTQKIIKYKNLESFLFINNFGNIGIVNIAFNSNDTENGNLIDVNGNGYNVNSGSVRK